jgi:protein SCO1/2
MSARGRAWTALGTLGLVLAIAAAWWALALWPVGPDAPRWLLRTREVCFGATADSLPHAGGWMLLIGQPLSLIVLLAMVWGAELRAGFSLALARAGGQLAVGAVLAALIAGLGSVVVRVRAAGQEPFSAGAADIAARLTRVNDAAPGLALTDQSGRQVTLADFRGRPVVVTFAYAHCQTVCPLIVADVMAARSEAAGAPPAVLVVTLDPWRDTPGRLPSIASAWKLEGDAHVLSGPPDDVERVLSAWRVPRTRNLKTGDIAHPSIVYVVNAQGRITYVVGGDSGAISAALRAL